MIPFEKDKMRRYICLLLVLGLAFCLIINTQAFAARTLYDDFSGSLMDKRKWIELELVREVAAGKLVSKIRNAAGEGNFNHTQFQNPSSINAIQTDITVVSTNLNTGTDSMPYAIVHGTFYNTQSSGGSAGDVQADVFIVDHGSGLQVFWEVNEILDDNWTSAEVKGSGTLIEPGTLDYNTPYIAKIEYDGNNGFQFTVAGVSVSFIGPSRLRPAVMGFKSLSTTGVGYTSVLFDNVYINNEGVYEDFSSPSLNPDKWIESEVAREVSNGFLQFYIQGENGNDWVSTYLSDSKTSYLEAKVRIESDSQFSSGAWGIARIQGTYYNDSRGPGSGREYNESEGDVFVQVRLQLQIDGALKAKALVIRSDIPIGTTLFNEYF